MDKEHITKQFDACLLTDDEIALGMDAWKSFNDPFPKWAISEEEPVENPE
jgi:hypothetical protein